MTPAEVLGDLFRAEIDLRLAEDGVNLAAPAGRLTPVQRAMVLQHKAALVQFLRTTNEPEPPAEPGAWRELDKAYQLHHFACSTCIAAGLGYGLRCGVGAALWTIYQNTN